MQNTTKFNTTHHRIHHKKSYHKFHHETIEINKFYHEKKYDSILIIMNKLIKYFYIISFKKNTTRND